MTTIRIRPTDKPIRNYYAVRQELDAQGVKTEGNVRRAFGTLLAETAHQRNWTLVEELSEKSKRGTSIRPDGTLRDPNHLPYGYWEAKDTADDLDAEIRTKIGRGYPLSNIIFEDTRLAVLYQSKKEVFRADLSKPEDLAQLLTLFYSYNEPNFQGFEQAVIDFQQQIPDLGRRLAAIIKEAHQKNTAFQAAYDVFFNLCREALNPNLSREAVDEMLIQHLLTERLMRRVFNNPDFTRRNVIAAEVEKVIDALTSHSFSREEFFREVERFYIAIENAARSLTDFKDKQYFINGVYERFFQGYSVKVADTHGIVYTPHQIVDFMCAAVEEVLHDEFGLPLSHPDVVILDPCTGTGNFIINLMNRVPRHALGQFYREQLFANEVMLLPYYIAALNIEHAYYDLTGEYAPFEGLVFADTLDLVKHHNIPMFAPRNTQRMERERHAPITVIIGNPPYNVGQLNENDNNKNRRYEVVDARVRETYARDSAATNKNALSDVYVKFFRWATDRLGDSDGIVCFVSNNGFLNGIAFDGFRKHLQQDFDLIYHFDFKGNARTSGERRRQEGGNIFSNQIRVGVGITLLVRKGRKAPAQIYYHVVPDYWRAEQKKQYLTSFRRLSEPIWRPLVTNDQYFWLISADTDEYADFLPIGTKETKATSGLDAEAIFKTYSGGVKTNRDDVVYDFDRGLLMTRVKGFIEEYNAEVDRYRRAGGKAEVDDFVRYDKVKWSESLKANLQRGNYAEYDETKIRTSLYRPFTRKYLFFDHLLNERTYVFPRIFPTPETEQENQVICLSGLGSNKPFHTLLVGYIPCLDMLEKTQCFPFYVYDADGGNRRENITDWALGRFRARYGSAGVGETTSPPSPLSEGEGEPAREVPLSFGEGLGVRSTIPESGLGVGSDITKWDIFYYVYGLLHHPGYRARYADNLRRELPRLPFAPDFWAFSQAGRRLAELHLTYEQAEPYPLEWVENPHAAMSYRVEKMRLNRDKTELRVNDWLTLKGIPPEVYEYRLGNRSALEWVIDQYQVKTDSRSGIVSDPNNPDDPEYIIRLVGQVITVSLETVAIIKALPEDFGVPG